MNISKHIPLRDARDHLSEWLKFGKPYPVQDVPVQEIELKVPFNSSAKIAIAFSQTKVLYQLHADGKVVTRAHDGGVGNEVAIEAEGNGATLFLETYRIQERVSFNIYAQKIPVYPVANAAIAVPRNAYLHHFDNVWKMLSVIVEVGLDTGLRAWLNNAPRIDGNVVDLQSPAARIINYGQPVEVEIENSQEGVEYSLVIVRANGIEEVISEADKLGNLHNITLTSKPLAEDEDIVIRIRAVKNFVDEGIDREAEIELLQVQLPVKIRANPALAVAANPLITAYDKSATIRVANSQSTAFYQVYSHAIRDHEYIHRPFPAENVIVIPVTNEANVQVQQPDISTAWIMPSEYMAVDAEQSGNGGNLNVTQNNLTVDSLFIIQARKTHEVQEGETIKTYTSVVQLMQAVVVLVEPNPNQMLYVQVTLDGAVTDSKLLVRGGEPGVFYTFALEPDGEALAQPAYFHKRDDTDSNLNKGIEQFKTEVDFVITQHVPNMANTTAPPDPLLDTVPVDIDTELFIQAMKAQTRVAVPLANTATLSNPPEIRLQDAVVDFGGETKILVIASVEGEKYQPLQEDGSIFKQLRKGNGGDLSFNTDKLEVDTLYMVLITPVQESGIVVERIVKLLAQVRPNTNLVIRTTNSTVPTGNRVIIYVEKSQLGVQYQLLANDQPVGDVVQGNGADIELPSAALATNTIFAVDAQHTDEPQISARLKQQITVTVT